LEPEAVIYSRLEGLSNFRLSGMIYFAHGEEESFIIDMSLGHIVVVEDVLNSPTPRLTRS